MALQRFLLSPQSVDLVSPLRAMKNIGHFVKFNNISTSIKKNENRHEPNVFEYHVSLTKVN